MRRLLQQRRRLARSEEFRAARRSRRGFGVQHDTEVKAGLPSSYHRTWVGRADIVLFFPARFAS